jgi:alpha-amylase
MRREYIDRRIEICSAKLIKAWLKYEFPGRRQADGELKHSSFQWRAEHFNGTDWDEKMWKNAIYKIIDDPTTTTVGSAAESEKQGDDSQTVSQQKKEGRSLTRFLSSSSPLRSLLHHLKSSPTHSVPHQRPGKTWALDLPPSALGNGDYLIFSNIWHAHPSVRADLCAWGKWMVTTLGITAFRIDAALHISCGFLREWIAAVQKASWETYGKNAWVVGEVWDRDGAKVRGWIDAVRPLAEEMNGKEEGEVQIYAYDVPLLMNFSRISEAVRTHSRDADLRTLLTGPSSRRASSTGQVDSRALVALRPANAVTLVTNHDTQPGQASYTPMDSSLKALFYAFILLRQDGLPCVFWGDLIGTQGPHAEGPACRIPVYGPGSERVALRDVREGEESAAQVEWTRSVLPSLMLARKLFAYGEQRDYFDSAECIGWTRAGTGDRSGCVVVMSIGEIGTRTRKRMAAGSEGERWMDVLQEEGRRAVVIIDGDGFGNFPSCGCSVGVFVREGSDGFERFPMVFESEAFAG